MDFRDVSVGAKLSPLRIGPITETRVRAFADASGDRNPVHFDTVVARGIGLDGPAVHGMQLVAFIHEAAARFRPGIEVISLSTRFLAPVPVGDTVEITGRVVKISEREGRRTAVMRLFLHNGEGALASLGEAVIAPEPFEVAAP
jgi:acyl dehydratase